jgi:hypothetical protein
MEILKTYTNKTLAPCRYSFPVSTFDKTIEPAALLTSAGSGTLQEVVLTLAQNNDVVFTAIVSSVLWQEGEQGGYYRTLQDTYSL